MHGPGVAFTEPIRKADVDELRRLAVATGSPSLLLAWARAELERQMSQPGAKAEDEGIPF